MMSIDSWIKELSNIPCSINTRNIRLQILIHNNAISNLKRSFFEHLCIERDTETNTNHISLDFTSLLGFHIVWNAIISNDGYNLVSMNNFNTKFLGNGINDLTTLGI